MPIRQRIARHLGEAVSAPASTTSTSRQKIFKPVPSRLPCSLRPIPGYHPPPVINKVWLEVDGKIVSPEMLLPKSERDISRPGPAAVSGTKRKMDTPDEVQPQSFYGSGGSRTSVARDRGKEHPGDRHVAKKRKMAADKSADAPTKPVTKIKTSKPSKPAKIAVKDAVEAVGKLASQAKKAPPTPAASAFFSKRVTRSSSRLIKGICPQLSPEQKYLSYYDITLTYEDIKALRNDWLTDNNISFWEEWLEREILPKYPQARIVLLRPTMTMILTKERKLEEIKAALPDFKNVTHIFIPITDATNVSQAEGGTHWSLLLVSTLDGVAFHYDSLGIANYNDGYEASQRIARVLGVPLRFQNISDCPQQENGNDCGVYVCILMRHLLVKRLLNANAREKVSMSMHNMMIDAHGGRKEMLKIIESLRREGERRRSTSPFSLSSSKQQAPRID